MLWMSRFHALYELLKTSYYEAINVIITILNYPIGGACIITSRKKLVVCKNDKQYLNISNHVKLQMLISQVGNVSHFCYVTWMCVTIFRVHKQFGAKYWRLPDGYENTIHHLNCSVSIVWLPLQTLRYIYIISILNVECHYQIILVFMFAHYLVSCIIAWHIMLCMTVE